MRVRTTFSSRLLGGFALIVGLTVLMGGASAAALVTVTGSKDDVIASTDRLLSDSQQLRTIAEQRIADYRAYLLNDSADNLAAFNGDRDQFLAEAAELRASLTNPVQRRLLDTVLQAEKAYTAALEPTVQRRKNLTDLRNIAQLKASQVPPTRLALQQAITDLVARVRADLDTARRVSSRTAAKTIVLVCLLGGLAIASAAVIAVRLTRGLRLEVGAAVGHIRTSSAQLEAAAAQQAAGRRGQAGAMNEITTTINQLAITSRQIAANAQRVARIAEDTAAAARTGDATIDRTRTSIVAIRTQVDLIVEHMLTLGERSQQIGGVADLVAELAEQTNILAINATIEASGTGEHGRRFAVVADEIRKLADRTAESAKQIGTLIADVRGAVSTTVTATETGAKAVDAGVRQFDDATTSFQHIAQLVTTANDATAEIEQSTKEQSTAVEQVSMAATDTARITRESEAGAVQTRQTAAHLASLSTDLQKLVGTGNR
jgi:methyl-accepting chemotaxis protein